MLNIKPMTSDSALDSAFAALAHPARRAILWRLASGQASVNALAAPLDMSLPAVSRHIRVLEEAGLISRGREGQFRPCKINAAPIAEIVGWAEHYRPIWEARFDVMETLLNQQKDNTDE